MGTGLEMDAPVALMRMVEPEHSSSAAATNPLPPDRVHYGCAPCALYVLSASVMTLSKPHDLEGAPQTNLGVTSGQGAGAPWTSAYSGGSRR